MRAASASVQTYLNGVIAGNFPPNAYLCELFDFTLVNGVQMFITSFSENLKWRSRQYNVGGAISPQNTPFAQRMSWRCTNTLEIDTLELMMAAIPSMTLNGIPFLAACRRGDMGNAWVQVDRLILAPCQVTLDSNGTGVTLASGPAFSTDEWPTGSGIHPIVGSTAFVDGRMVTISSYADATHCTISPGGRAGQTVNAVFPIGTVNVFSGYWFEITELGRVTCKASIKSGLVKLNNAVPQRLFGPSCSHVVYDAGCGLAEADYKFPGTVQSGSTAFQINTALTPQAPINPPAAAPTYSYVDTSNANIPEVTYYLQQTYVYALGETPTGPQSVLNFSSHKNRVVTVNSPPSVTGATGWNLYAAVNTGAHVLQNPSPIAIGSSWTEGQLGMTSSGVYPPVVNSQGYYSQGYIQFTSGILGGLRFPIKSNAGGALTMEVPLPAVPTTGDSFFAVPSCELTMSACTNKFATTATGSTPGSNLVHFSGTPFVPQPERGFVGASA